MSFVRGNEHGYAGAVYKPGQHGNHIPAVEGFKKIRELVAIQEKLHKEVARLGNRNDSLGKEVAALNNEKLSHTREIKILRTINDKISFEKNELTAEYKRCKEQRDRLEVNFGRLSNGAQLQEHIESLKEHIDTLNKDLYLSQNRVLDRDARIEVLEQEVNALNIALDNHVHYDKPTKLRGGDTFSREKLKDMCIQLSKKEAEVHKLSATLANASSKLDQALGLNEELTLDKEVLKIQLIESVERFDILSEELDVIRMENEKLCNGNSTLQSTLESHENKIGDLNADYAGMKLEKETAEAALSEKTAELNVFRDEHHAMITSLRKRLEANELSIQQNKAIMAMSEQKLSRQRDQLAAERDSMRDKLQRVDYLEREIEIIRSSSFEKLQEGEETVHELREELLRSRTDLEQHRRDLSVSSEKASVYDKLIRENGALSDALQNAMETAKGVKAKLQHEIKHREMAEAAATVAEERVRVAEERALQAEKSKSYSTGAILDALDQEKEKSTILEKELHILRSSGSFGVMSRTAVSSSRRSSDSSAESVRDSGPLPPAPPLSPERVGDQTVYHSPQKPVDSNIAATHDLIGEMLRMRGDLDRVTEEASMTQAEINDRRTIFFQKKSASRSFDSNPINSTSDDDEIMGARIIKNDSNKLH